MKRDDWIGHLSAIGCEILFGLSYVFTKQVTASASELSLLGWRFLLAFAFMYLLRRTGFIHINLKDKPLKPLLAIALCHPVLYFIGETVGISQTTASESGIFLAIIPVASLIASNLFLKKQANRRQVTGILITLCGVLLTVYAAGISSSFSIVGYSCLILAVISYALYSVLVERAKGYTEIEITYVMLAVGMAVFLSLALGEAMIRGNLKTLLALPFQDRSFLIAILYQGLACSVLAFFMNNVAIEKIGVNQTASYIGLSTVVSMLAGALILKETITPEQILGAIVILIGVYVANSNFK